MITTGYIPLSPLSTISGLVRQWIGKNIGKKGTQGNNGYMHWPQRFTCNNVEKTAALNII